jgi:hypothetical protein
MVQIISFPFVPFISVCSVVSQNFGLGSPSGATTCIFFAFRYWSFNIVPLD